MHPICFPSVAVKSMRRIPRSAASIRQSLARVAVAVFCSVLLCATSHAATDQTALFRQAQTAIAKGNINAYRQIQPQLINHPLYPYLEYAELRQGLAAANSSTIDAFLKRYEGSYVADRLNRDWLIHLGMNQQWDRFMAYYHPAMSSGGDINCMYANALLARHDKTADETMRKIWLTSNSTPRTCERPLALWREQGGLTGDLVWQRFELALRSNRDSLGIFLKRYMSQHDSAAAGAAIVAVGKPLAMAKTWSYSLKDARFRSAFLLGVHRLAQTHPDNAAQLFTSYRTQLPADGINEYRELINHVGMRLARDNPSRALAWLVQQDPNADDVKSLEARLQLAVRTGSWDGITRWVQLLPEDLRSNERWQYWYARALQQQDTKASKDEAQLVLAKLANKRGWYGFLAADKLKLPYSMQHEPLNLSSTELSQLEKTGGIHRAMAWKQMGDHLPAMREWWFTVRNMPVKQRVGAAMIASKQQWHALAILTMAEAGYWNDIEIRFPLAYQQDIFSAARKSGLNPNWVYAITRQESAFKYDAKSGAGAMGLMQLMPATAKATARSLGMRYTDRDLLDPTRNTELGATYLSQVYRRFGGNPILATAAYNAGPGRVVTWLRNAPAGTDWAQWVEAIPFSETRQYVQNVMAFSAIYGHRLGKPSTLALNELQAPRAYTSPSSG